MTEISTFIRELGVPIAAMVALAVVLYKIGTVCGTLLIESWKAKDTRVGELEQRVDGINNGQRAALEGLQIRSTEALQAVAAALDRQADKFEEWAESRKCLYDSDAILDAKAIERIKRRRDRTETKEG